MNGPRKAEHMRVSRQVETVPASCSSANVPIFQISLELQISADVIRSLFTVFVSRVVIVVIVVDCVVAHAPFVTSLLLIQYSNSDNDL